MLMDMFWGVVGFCLGVFFISALGGNTVETIVYENVNESSCMSEGSYQCSWEDGKLTDDSNNEACIKQERMLNRGIHNGTR